MLTFSDVFPDVMSEWRAKSKSRLYADDVEAWAYDVLGERFWSKQLEFIQSFQENRRTAVKSCHGVGKSWTAGMLAAWWLDTHPVGEAIVVSPASYDSIVEAVGQGGTSLVQRRELEPFDRGRYAGPVGWVDAAGNGEWAIALRCAQIDPDDERTLRMYAGCGIVAGSVPTDELAESQTKLLAIREALESH